jgi:hypothetical protein
VLSWFASPFLKGRGFKAGISSLARELNSKALIQFDSSPSPLLERGGEENPNRRQNSRELTLNRDTRSMSAETNATPNAFGAATNNSPASFAQLRLRGEFPVDRDQGIEAPVFRVVVADESVFRPNFHVPTAPVSVDKHGA